MAQITYEEVSLMLRLYDMRREQRLRQARAWFVEHFHPESPEEMMQRYPQGSEENTYIRMVISYWDMVAGIVNRGLINDELFFDSNGEIRTVSNLSRDWSQAFVDVSLAPESPIEKTLQALETAAAGLRGDPAWSQALVDGPRILGVQNFDRNSSTVRLQVRTAPTRQEEVARELRRRIQLEFQKQGIPVSSVQRIELAGVSHSAQEAAQQDAAS